MARSTSIVCVSHLTGAEGEAVARGVAERLGFRYLDEQIIERAAESAELDPAVVGQVERRKSLVRRIGEMIRAEPMSRRPDASAQRRSGDAPARETPSDEDLRALVRDAIRDTAAEGNIVIASHAAAMVLADRNDTLRVLVTASETTRARRVASVQHIDERPAEKLVADADASRADYFRRFHNVDRELPIHYDLVVNTDVLPAEVGADLVALAAQTTDST
jgi:cytidylate kinase